MRQFQMLAAGCNADPPVQSAETYFNSNQEPGGVDAHFLRKVCALHRILLTG